VSVQFGELEVVRLARDLERYFKDKIRAGTEGTIVSVHNGGEAYEVEFTDVEGVTLDVLTLQPEWLEATGKADP